MSVGYTTLMVRAWLWQHRDYNHSKDHWLYWRFFSCIVLCRQTTFVLYTWPGNVHAHVTALSSLFKCYKARVFTYLVFVSTQRCTIRLPQHPRLHSIDNSTTITHQQSTSNGFSPLGAHREVILLYRNRYHISN